MAEAKNPLTDRVKKMAAILEAAKKAGEEVEKERVKEGQAETGQPGPSSEQPPS
jgi:hypothetical protein